MKCINGFCSKYKSFTTKKNKIRYYLSANNFTFDLPNDAQIRHIYFRANAQGLTAAGETMITAQQYAGGTLTLKSLKGGISILDNVPLVYLQPHNWSNQVQVPEILLQPHTACEINWTDSYVEFNAITAAAIDDGRGFDMVILYSRPGQDDLYQSIVQNQQNQTNICYRAANMQININPSQQYYQLAAAQLIGIDTQSVLYGYYLAANTGVVPPLGLNGEPTAQSMVREAFLTLKKKGIYEILDTMPLEIPAPFEFGWQFFPIEPTKVCEIDWESSKIFLPVPSNLAVPVASFVFTLYYKNANELS